MTWTAPHSHPPVLHHVPDPSFVTLTLANPHRFSLHHLSYHLFLTPPSSLLSPQRADASSLHYNRRGGGRGGVGGGLQAHFLPRARTCGGTRSSVQRSPRLSCRKWRGSLKFPVRAAEEEGERGAAAERCCSEAESRDRPPTFTELNFAAACPLPLCLPFLPVLYRCFPLFCRRPFVMRGTRPLPPQLQLLLLCAFLVLLPPSSAQPLSCQEVRTVFHSLHPGSKWVPENPVSGNPPQLLSCTSVDAPRSIQKLFPPL